MEFAALGLTAPKPIRLNNRSKSEKGRILVLEASEKISNVILMKVGDLVGGEEIKVIRTRPKW
jgi:hypothetical protein